MIGLGLGLGIGGRYGGSTPEVFDPATLSLTGWWRASYGGSPWAGVASAGASGSRTLAEAGTPPAVGAALNSLDTADFDGSDDCLKTAAAASSYVTDSAGSYWILFNADAAAAAEATPVGDASVLGLQASGFMGCAINSTGFRPWIHDGAYKSVTIATGSPTGAWILGQAKWNGTTLYGRINGGSWSSTAAGAVGDLSAVLKMGGHFTPFNGLVAEMGITDSALSDDDFDDIVSYIESRYGLTF